MAQDAGVQLSALCAVASFLWVSYTFERHSLIEKPRLSSLLILSISGLLAFLASFFSAWLPGADGRFDEGSKVLKTARPRPNLPNRPRRLFLPTLVLCIVSRLEVFHRVSIQLQCSTPGVECFLCCVLVFYDIVFGRKTRPSAISEPEDPWGSVSEDILNWFKGARLTLIGSVLLFNYATYSAVGQAPRSTFFCSSLLDSRASTLFLQVFGLLLDGVIAVLLWRILAWSNTTKTRLRTLSSILLLSSLCISLLWVANRLLASSGIGRYPPSFKGIGSLYIFDVVIDSFTFSTLIISSSFLVSETNPLTPVSIITFLCGFLASLQNIARLGTWRMQSKSAALVPLYLLSVGFSIFLYASNMRSVVYIRRVFVLLLLAGVLVGMTTYTLLITQTVDRHPLDKLIYDTRVEADRWLRHATVSDSVRVAVKEYQERHHGRDPPPNFDKWYEFAKGRKSVILDRFEQIEKDILPFWGMKPELIRKAIESISQEPTIVILTIREGRVSHDVVGDERHQQVLSNLVQMIQGFVDSLPDMDLPINLIDQPRVLTPWSDINRFTKSGRSKTFGLLSRRSEETADAHNETDRRDVPSKPRAKVPGDELELTYTSADALREMEALACPAGSLGRSGVHWNSRDLCSACTAPYSQGQFLTNWARSQDLCAQPDITRLHSFHLSPPWLAPLQDLIPIFSRSKPEGFNDILIPLTRPTDDKPDWAFDFNARKDALFWRGRLGNRPISQQALRGNHKHRVVHLVNNATALDEVTLMLPTASNKNKIGYETAHTIEANSALPFDIGISDYSTCVGLHCAITAAEFGQKGDSEPLHNRYVLLLDENDQPPLQLLRTLRSSSVPFVSSIFKEWYTERLMPWIHFVPIDLRFHALHSTLAYFVGLKGRGKVNGRDVDLDGRLEDARWIANQGRIWADKAIRREDMEVYLFRLLLEWGRVINEDRDKIGFRLGK